MALEIEITKNGPGSYTVKLTGSLDTETAEILDRRMAEVLGDGLAARSIRLDLHDLTYISSVGLGSIAKIRKGLHGGAMATVGAQPQIARVFEIAKMLPKQTVFATREEADAYLAAIQKQVLEENRPPATNL
jgi:anti-sigma B factor antagonist